MTKPFDLHDSLCRFLIVENDDAYSLFAVFHHIIFDALSDAVFKQDLLSILQGKNVEIDDSFLKVAAFNQQIEKTDEYVEAHDFYESMLADSEDAGVLLDSVGSDGNGLAQCDLDLNYDLFKSFLSENRISENVLFTGVFAYTLSRFVGNDKVLFNIIENGRDRFNNFNSIGMFVNTLPLLVDCRNQEISSFLDSVSNTVYDAMRYNSYPFRLMAKEYGIDSGILFQFMPDWIEGVDIAFTLMTVRSAGDGAGLRMKQHGFRRIRAAVAAHQQIRHIARHAGKPHFIAGLDQLFAALALRKQVERVERQAEELVRRLLARADL